MHGIRAFRAAALIVASLLHIWLRRGPRVPACREDHSGVTLNGCIDRIGQDGRPEHLPLERRRGTTG